MPYEFSGGTRRSLEADVVEDLVREGLAELVHVLLPRGVVGHVRLDQADLARVVRLDRHDVLAHPLQPQEQVQKASSSC